ncbi:MULTISPECIES: glutathione S-transferase family protein [unclassified Rhizobium]|uniref:glutathione S-transferase family protein n=1 Tax=unclassified Rhizobium TaxID=2613769 RepID=UPI0006FDE670|nr:MULTISPECIES: glutathione S-transferase family protein [unclassified Rhizobium]KQV34368.1 glutathione S-transferase [Rhizobium sp. Root1212]KRD23746.1 glutathione S-transferase [Rhizobium sp. Root268]
MILIGQYDSSFVRRVGIALRLYNLPFEHQPWSVFSEGDKVQSINPLMRVPTLILDGGDVLVDSPSMLDYLDGLMPEDQRLFPAHEPERRRAMRIAALATGLADKGVSLFYELRLHEQPAMGWVGRLREQILAATAALEEWRRHLVGGDFWGGRSIGHCDIAVACAWRHVREAHPDLLDEALYPKLAAFCSRLEGLPVFREISQPFIAPA